MKVITFKYTLIIIFFTLITSCKPEQKQELTQNKAATFTKIKYAKGFEIQHFNEYSILKIKAPYLNTDDVFEFKLSKQPIKNGIQIPVKKIVVTSTTHIPMLELLNEEEKLIGFPNTDYISSSRTRALINSREIMDLGNEENMNTELLMALKPDVVIGFTLNSNNKMYNTIEKMGIPVILNGAWLEETPLGRAEWIKMFGVLFDKEIEAQKIFNDIEQKYIEAKRIAQKATKQPTIISGGLFKDIWNLPAGNSFEATFLKDANTNYLWKNSKGNGSLSLNIENVFEKGKDADLWISPSFNRSLEDLEKANDIYAKFKAFQTKNVYSFVNKRGEKGGIIYFELATARPDLVLKDLIKIAHPNLLNDYNLTFFERLN